MAGRRARASLPSSSCSSFPFSSAESSSSDVPLMSIGFCIPQIFHLLSHTSRLVSHGVITWVGRHGLLGTFLSCHIPPLPKTKRWDAHGVATSKSYYFRVCMQRIEGCRETTQWLIQQKEPQWRYFISNKTEKGPLSYRESSSSLLNLTFIGEVTSP